MLVRLQRPPPVTLTFANGLEWDSKTVTFASGRSSFSRCAQKQPAAPAPMMAMFFMREWIKRCLNLWDKECHQSTAMAKIRKRWIRSGGGPLGFQSCRVCTLVTTSSIHIKKGKQKNYTNYTLNPTQTLHPTDFHRVMGCIVWGANYTQTIH